MMQEQRINIGNNQKDKIITKELKINKNVFIFNETVIPLNNISQIHVASAYKKSYNASYFVMLLVGMGFLFADKLILKMLGLALVLGGAYLIFTVFQYNRDLGEYLVLQLNSGRDLYLYSHNHDFTIEIMDVIINCINSGQEYKINMQNCRVEACQFGEHNIMRS